MLAPAMSDGPVPAAMASLKAMQLLGKESAVSCSTLKPGT